MSGAEHDRPGVLIFPPLLFALCLVAGAVAHLSCPFRFHGAWMPWVGSAVALTAWGVALRGDRTMRAAGTNVRPDKPALAIVDRGPFAVSRNPLYVSVIVIFTGLGIALRSPAFLAIVVPLALVLRFGVIAREEVYLEGKFGDTYRDYRARVRRWL